MAVRNLRYGLQDAACSLALSAQEKRQLEAMSLPCKIFIQLPEGGVCRGVGAWRWRRGGAAGQLQGADMLSGAEKGDTPDDG